MLRTLSLGLVYFTAHLVCLVSSQECYEESRLGESPSDSCFTMSSIFCGNEQNIELLLKGTVTLTCTIGTSTPTFSKKRISCNSGVHEPIENGANYTVNGNKLIILSADHEDEGEYFCSNDASMTNPFHIACVYVSGFARFRTCDLGTPATLSYSRASNLLISRMNSCYQTLNVTEGQITLDTRLMFMEGSCCRCREHVERLAVRFNERNSVETYACDEANIPCTGRNNVVVSRQSSKAFDFMLKVNLTATDSVQRIYIEIEVDRPQNSDRGVFWKVFEVTVNRGKLSTMPTSSATTMIPDATEGTDNVPVGVTKGPVNPGDIEGLDDPSGSVAGPAVGAAVVIVVIIAGVVILAAVLLSRQHRTESKDLMTKKEKEEVFYETIDVVKLQSTTQGGKVHIFRESVYNFDSNRQLELHLESKICAKV